jgi:iron complex outermembrane recepter protein
MTRDLYRQTLLALAAAAVYHAPVALAQDDSTDPFAIYDDSAADGAETTANDPAPIAVEPLRSETPPELQSPVAPEADRTRLDTVQVTGSRIRRTDFETSQPLLVLTRDDIERTGITTIGDILQRIPAAGSALNTTFNNGGTGATEIDLRNLGSNRVLVLVNGHRWVNGVSFANTASVDLNTIPVSIVERIEVLKDGASAVYGSDAIAGVVNVITRKNYVGTELRGQLGAFDKGDGEVYSANFSMGTAGDLGNLFVDIGHIRQEPIFAGDREISSVPLFGTGITRGSIFTPRGTVLFVPNAANGNILGTERCPDLAPAVAAGVIDGQIPGAGAALGGLIGSAPTPPVGGLQLCNMILRRGETVMPGETTAQVVDRYQPFNGTTLNNDENDLYNFAPINYLRTPLEQTSLFLQGSREVTSAANATVQVLYNRRSSQQVLAETPLLFGNLVPPPYNQAFIDATNIFNPFDQDIGRSGEDGLIGLGIVGRRFVELGPRIQTQTVDTFFGNLQFDGQFTLPIADLEQFFTWDGGASFGRSQLNNLLSNNLNIGRVARALGPDMACTGAIDGCVPLDLFGGEGSITPEMLSYVRANLADNAVSTTEDFYLNFSTEIPLGDVLPAPLGMAFGAEYRRDRFRDTPDALTQGNLSSGNNRRATAGEISVREAYLELGIPLLAGLPFVQNLDLSIAGRFSDYSILDDSVTTGKLGIEYRPYADLLVRATVSEGFRAPSVTELFLGGTDAFPMASDPCVGREPGSDVDQNCDAEGVPDNVDQTSTQILTRFGGNPNLEAEASDSFTAGLVFSPQQVPGLTVFLDYFDIQIEDFIGTVGPQFVLDQCFRRPAGTGRPDSCDLVTRNANGSVSSINAAFLNFARVETAGVDLGFEYELPFFREFGVFKFQFDSQFLDRYDQFTPTADGTFIKDKLAGLTFSNVPLPRFKGNLRLNWSWNQLEASWLVRYLGTTTEACTDAFQPRLADLGVCSEPDFDLTDGSDDSRNRLGSTVYNDVQLTYKLPGQAYSASLVFGVNNVLNRDPPRSITAFANSFSATLYEIPGMQPYIRMGLSF